MHIFGKPIAEIDVAFLEQLRDARVQESVTHDYKAQLPDARGEDKRPSFAIDVAALANTQGGVLICGFDAPREGTWSLPGLADFEYDARVNSLEQMLARRIDPRLPRLTYLQLDRSEAAPLLLIGVPRSLAAPHGVVMGSGAREFWRRGTIANYPMSHNELRDAFLEADRWLTEAAAFHDHGTRAIQEAASITTEADWSRGTVAMHLVPLGRLRDSLATAALDAPPSVSPTHVGGDWLLRPTFLGNRWLFQPDRETRPRWFLDYWNGAGEFVSGLDAVSTRVSEHGEGFVTYYGDELELLIATATRCLLDRALARGVGFPFALFVTLRLIKGAPLVTKRRRPSAQEQSLHYDRSLSRQVERELVDLPPLPLLAPPADLPSALRPLLDRIWTAAGRERSPVVQDDGAWMMQSEYDAEVRETQRAAERRAVWGRLG